MSIFRTILFILVYTSMLGCIELNGVPGEETGYSNQTALNIEVSGRNIVKAKYKVGLVSSTDCNDGSDYSEFVPTPFTIDDNISHIPDGELRLCVKAWWEGVSAKAILSETAGWIKDTTAPEGFEITGPNDVVRVEFAEISWSQSIDATIYYLIVASTPDCSQPVQQADLTDLSKLVGPLQDGDYYVCLSSQDLAGNIAQATNNGFGFTVDTSPETRIFATSFRATVSTDQGVPPIVPDSFGSIAAADWVCTNAAFTAGLVPVWNGVDTPWRAILSTENDEVRFRISFRGALYNMNDEIVAGSDEDLWNNQLQNPVSYDEFGELITGDDRVWTGSAGGYWSGESCEEWNHPFSTWTGSHGNLHYTGSNWQFHNRLSCDLTARLYCINQ